MLEGLLLEVVCKEELKRTITHDFMYISVVLVFFGPPCISAKNVHGGLKKVLNPKFHKKLYFRCFFELLSKTRLAILVKLS